MLVEMALVSSLFLILPCACIWVLHAYVKHPTAAALGTWVMLTVIGVSLTFVSFFLYMGVGHGGPAPAGLPVLAGIATLSLPLVAAFKMLQFKEIQGSDTEELAGTDPSSDLPPHDDGAADQTTTSGDEVE